MRIPVERVDLETLGFPGYWIDMPRSVKEGFLHEFLKTSSSLAASAKDADGEDVADNKTMDRTRETNIKLLELVTDWNIDDDAGKILPIMSKAKTKAERERIVAEIPVTVLVDLARRVAGNVSVPERTKDF